MVSITKAVGVGLICLFVAFAFPTFIETTDNTTLTDQVVLEGTGSSKDVGGALRISVNSKTDTQANLSVAALKYANTTDVVVNETENQTVQLDGDNVTVTAHDIGSGASGFVILEATYPRSMGWADSTLNISENLPIVMASLAFILVAGLIAAVVKS